ncbi:hypothetical protein HKX48_006376 [Thoreauomyces humboldtii]|nr:hypothetical protein HKX48_006376 [Thoreauomyces humboldtii]
MTADDINHALRVRNVEPLYGWASGKTTKFNLITQGTQQLYYVDDLELDLDDILNGPLPPVPLDVTHTAHWLAIEGVQPSIVQNPSPADLAARAPKVISMPVLTNGLAATGGAGGDGMLVKAVLTRELQMYYEKVTEALTSGSEELRSLAVQSVTKDPGIQPLLPYLIQFVAEQVTHNIRKLHVTHAMMRLTRAMLDNPTLFVEPYLHQLVPNILTCMVAKRLCEDPTTEDHWSLRTYAAQLASHVCVTYGASYESLQPRVTKTLLRAFLDPLKPLSTSYGGIVGLAALGDEAVKILLVPNVTAFGDRIAGDLDGMEVDDAAGAAKAGKRIEATKCREIIVTVIAGFIRRSLANGAATAGGSAVVDETAVRGQIAGTYGNFADSIANAVFSEPL